MADPIGGYRPPQSYDPKDPDGLENTRGLVKQVTVLSAIAAVIAAISSGTFLVSDNKDDIKKGEKLARVYVILELTVILCLATFVALKVAPYVLSRLRR